MVAEQGKSRDMTCETWEIFMSGVEVEVEASKGTERHY